MSRNELKRAKELEAENVGLKRMYAIPSTRRRKVSARKLAPAMRLTAVLGRAGVTHLMWTQGHAAYLSRSIPRKRRIAWLS